MCARRFKFESNRNPPAWWFDHRVCPLNPLPHVCVADRFGPDWCYPNSPQGSNYGLPALQHELGLRREQHRYSAVAILAPGRSAAIDALAAPPCGGERAVSQRNRTFVPQWHTFCHNTSAPAALQLIAEMWLAAHACPLLLNAHSTLQYLILALRNRVSDAAPCSASTLSIRTSSSSSRACESAEPFYPNASWNEQYARCRNDHNTFCTREEVDASRAPTLAVNRSKLPARRPPVRTRKTRANGQQCALQ